jgi:hypothetical protein
MAMPWAMLLLLMAAALSAVLLERGRGLAAETSRDDASVRALYAAEGGLAFARHILTRDPDYAGGTIRVGACAVEIVVTKADDVWSVAVTARPGSVRLAVRLRGAEGLPAIVSWAER